MRTSHLTLLGVALLAITGCATQSGVSGSSTADETVVVQGQGDASSSTQASGDASMSLDQYLAGGRQPIINTYCSDPNSLFSRSTANNTACQARVAEVFDYCVDEELDGVLAPRITNRLQADATARIVTDCVLAYQEGPSSVAQFRVKLMSAAQQNAQ